MSAVKVADLPSLHEFNLRLKAYVNSMDQAGQFQALNEEGETFTRIAGKLDDALGMRYYDWLSFQHLVPSIRTLLCFLKDEVQTCRKLGNHQRVMAEKSTRLMSRTFVARGGESEDDDEPALSFQSDNQLEKKPERVPPDCDACGDQHLLRDCPVFTGKSPQERLDLIFEKNRCYRCLRVGHNTSSCNSQIKCKQCDKRHHTLLHGAKTPSQRRQEREKAFLAEDFAEDTMEMIDDKPIKVLEYAQVAMCESSLGTAPVNLTCSDSKKVVQINALLDTGNTVPLLSEEAAKALELKGYQDPTTIQGVGGKIVKSQIRAKVTLSSLDGKVKEAVWVRIVPTPAGSLKAVDWNKHKTKFGHLKHLNFPKPCERRAVDLILGATTGSLIRSLDRDVYGQNSDDPVARLTPLGWVAAGKTDPEASMESCNTLMSFFTRAQEQSVEEGSSDGPTEGLSSPISVVDESISLRSSKENIQSSVDGSCAHQSLSAQSFEDGSCTPTMKSVQSSEEGSCALTPGGDNRRSRLQAPAVRWIKLDSFKLLTRRVRCSEIRDAYKTLPTKHRGKGCHRKVQARSRKKNFTQFLVYRRRNVKAKLPKMPPPLECRYTPGSKRRWPFFRDKTKHPELSPHPEQRYTPGSKRPWPFFCISIICARPCKSIWGGVLVKPRNNQGGDGHPTDPDAV